MHRACMLDEKAHTGANAEALAGAHEKAYGGYCVGSDAWSPTGAPAGARKGAKKARFLRPLSRADSREGRQALAVAPKSVALEEISESLGAKPQRDKKLVPPAAAAVRLAYPILLLHVLFPARLH